MCPQNRQVPPVSPRLVLLDRYANHRCTLTGVGDAFAELGE